MSTIEVRSKVRKATTIPADWYRRGVMLLSDPFQPVQAYAAIHYRLQDPQN